MSSDSLDTDLDAGLDIGALRRSLGAFATGVTVVTTVDANGDEYGFTANSFTSVSLDPPLVLVCLAKAAGCYAAFLDASHYAISILSEHQRDISVTFASSNNDKFAHVARTPAGSGCAVISDAVAWLDCAVHEKIDAGDHIILIGRVLAFDSSDRAPLGYCRGAYVSFGLSQQALRATEADDAVRVSAIIEHDSQILFVDDPNNEQDLVLPMASQLGSSELPASLMGRLHEWGVEAPSLYLFAVFDQAQTHHIVYRGDARTLRSNSKPSSFSLVALSQVQLARVVDDASKAILERYIRERQQENFEVGKGDAHSDEVRFLPHKSN